MSKIDKTDIDEQIAAGIKNFSTLAKDDAARQASGVRMPEFIQQKAQLISAHFLLPAGARIVDMGCERGEVTYALAQLNPRAEIIGIDADAGAIEFARKGWRLPNLSYRVSDISIPDMEDESVDGIVNSNVLHHVYSAESYDPHAVTAMLDRQVRKLKTGGVMLIRDYMMPPEGEYVLLELPAAPGRGADPLNMSDAELLLSFSQTARPLEAGSEGFHIEELPARRSGTRLFRLPHKWACEFVHRKNYRAGWNKELKEEYTFFTGQDYRRELTRLGMRMVYSAPYWNPWVVKNCFKGKIQLYTDAGAPLPAPATNYFIVAQKVADRQSLLLEERRPSQKPVGDLQITTVKDTKTGVMHDIVKRPGEYCDIVPYRVTSDNRLVVYVRSGYPRPIVNAVLRGSQNLDGKKWSGHFIEPISMDISAMTDMVEENRKAIFEYMRGYAGLRAKTEESWYVGQAYFPAPDFIDEAIEPVFIEVENPQKTVWPAAADKDTGFAGDAGFSGTGTITELDASDIMLASQVGLLPEPRLELHVLDLMIRHNIPQPPWIGEVMPKILPEQVKPKSPEDILKDAAPAAFEDMKNVPADLRAVKSVFVEEGRVGQATRGLSTQDIEFVISHDGVENIAAIVPLTRDMENNLLMGIEAKIMSVPNRLGGGGAMFNVPTFVMPPSVRNMDEARAWVAEKFSVPPEQVGCLGESYFIHAGVTPQRIYPFVVANAPGGDKKWPWQYTMMKSFTHFWWCHNWDYNMSGQAMKMASRTMKQVGENNDMTQYRVAANMKGQGPALSADKTGADGFAIPRSRILGQRPAPAAPPPQAMPPPAQNTVAQKIMETLKMPQLGGKLTQSYSQALTIKDALQKISMQRTPSMTAFNRGIDTIGDQIGKAQTGKPAVPKPPELTPPDPAPRGRK